MRLTYRQCTSSDLCDFTDTNENAHGPLEAATNFVVLLGSDVLFIVGYMMFWEGTATIWMHTKRNIELPPIGTVKICKRLIDEQLGSLRRVQCFIDPNNLTNIRFIECIGFVYESTMVEGNPDGGDFLIYRRK